jgi:secondary thiamine-phosphate synthase enzyme
MSLALWPHPVERPAVEFRAASEQVQLRTTRALQLIDISELVSERVRRSGITTGLASVQVLHTTAALIVNENEPLLLQDIEQALERLSPCNLRYAHDDLSLRENAAAAERLNGHAHCKALPLAPSLTLHIVGGRLQLGRWQRLFLVELDGAQVRQMTIVLLGTGAKSTWPQVAELPCA